MYSEVRYIFTHYRSLFLWSPFPPFVPYRFCFRQFAVEALFDSEATSPMSDLLLILSNPQQVQFQELWSRFLFNLAEAQKLATISESEAKKLLAAKTNWAGGGWTICSTGVVATH